VWKGKDIDKFVLPSTGYFRGEQQVRVPEAIINMEDWVAFMGIFLAEGYTYKTKLKHKGEYSKWNCHAYRIGIAQAKKSKYFRDIEELLDKLPFNFRYNQGSFVCNSIGLYSYLEQFGKSWQKYIPKEILELDSKYLKVLWEWLLKGDGNRHKRSKGGNIHTSYSSVSQRLADNIQELLQKIGKDASISTRPPESGGCIKGRRIQGKRKRYIVLQRDSELRALRGERVKYEGKIYCVSVPNKVVYVRRNGRPMWCGNSAVFVAATVNKVLNLPPELLRKGRFDEVWGVDLPSPEEREEILKIHLQKRNRDPKNFDVVEIVKKTDKCTGAEVEAIFEDAMFMAFSDKREVETKDILTAIEATTPQVVSQSEEISAIRDWITKRARPVSSFKVGQWQTHRANELVEDSVRKVVTDDDDSDKE
jgi:hypothetical protein